MKMNLLFAVVLFVSLVGVISCKSNQEDASETVTARLQSYKTEFSLQVWGEGWSCQRSAIWWTTTPDLLEQWFYLMALLLPHRWRSRRIWRVSAWRSEAVYRTITRNEAGLSEIEDYSVLISRVPVEPPIPEMMTYTYKENVVTGMTDFDYQYDVDGNIIECILTYRMLNDEGSMAINDFIRFYDLKYWNNMNL